MSSVYVVCWIFLQTFLTNFCIQANSVDPDQTAPKGAVWSGSTLFAEMTYKVTAEDKADDNSSKGSLCLICTVKAQIVWPGPPLLIYSAVSTDL